MEEKTVEIDKEPKSDDKSLSIQKDIEMKQKLIKECIIDKNYDKNLFFNFCVSKKTDGGADNLANWSIEELNKIINDFTKEQNERMSDELKRQEEIKNQRSLAENIQLNMQQMNNNPQGGESTHFDLNPIEIPCTILPKSILNDKEVKVTIKNPKPIETGFFSSNYIVYEIETIIVPDNVKWVTERRYNDFIWLRQILVKLFPFHLVPPIPGKRMGGRRFELDFVSKRMHFLNEFMNNLIANEVFRASDALVSFLAIPPGNQFETKMKELNSLLAPINVEECKSLNGKLSISTEENINEKYFININQYFTLQVKILESLNDHMKSYYKSTNAVINDLENVRKDFELLQYLNTQVQMKQDIIKTFEELKIFFSDWKKITFNQNEVMKKYIKNFFKYIRMEGEAFLDLISSREEIRNKFVKENTKLLEKKEKLWSKMDMSKWEISEDYQYVDRILLFRDKLYAFSKMCTKETYILNGIKKYLGFATKANIDELKKLVGKYQNTFVDNLKLFSNNIYPVLSDSLDVWTKMASAVDA